MTSVAPMPVIAPGSADIGRPGQQLLPGYVVKLLKTLKIPFGTDRSMSGLDVDPTIGLISHLFECIGALRDVNKVYRAKGSMVSRSVGTRVLFGMTAELGNILLDAITFDPPPDLLDATVYYSQVASAILGVFPEIAAQVTPSTGKVLLHHTALRTSPSMALEALKMVLKAFPAGAWTPDRTGALPLHWMTHNPHCSQEMVNFLVAANPKSPFIPDVDGYLPLHWAVNQDEPNVDVVAALLQANPAAAARACNKGSLPVHWAVNRDHIHVGVLRALVQVHSDGVRTFDKASWLPIHQCCNRSSINLEALQLLIELYPQGLQCPNGNGQLPLHRCLDQPTPHLEAVSVLLQSFPGAAKVGDDEHYLPLHLALDCAAPEPRLAQTLLDAYPEGAFQKSRDGLLPLHCLISALQPSLEIAQMLCAIHPAGVEAMATDLVPADPDAEPDNWTGEWMERRWTPLSRAIDRGLEAFVLLFRDAQRAAQTGAPYNQGSSNSGSNVNMGSVQRGPGTQVSRMAPPQSAPPMHFAGHNNMDQMQQGQQVQLYDNGDHVELLDQEAIDAQQQQMMMHNGSAQNMSPDQHHMLQRPLPRGSPNTNSNHNLLQQRAPGGSVAGRPLTKDRDRDREHRDRERGDRGDRDRDRERGESREGGHRERRGDRDRDRERSASRQRSSGHHRSSNRDRDRDRDRERSSSRQRDRKDRDRDRDRERDRDRDGHRRRMYREEANDFNEDDNNVDYQAQDYNGNNNSSAPFNNSGRAPMSQPPKSLLDAAVQRPFARKSDGSNPMQNQQMYSSQAKHSRDLLGDALQDQHALDIATLDPSVPSNLDDIV